MKLTKRQLKRIIREEYVRLKIRTLLRESLDDLPQGEYSLSGTLGGPVDPASLELGQGDYAPYGDSDKLDQKLLDSFARSIPAMGETVEDFMEYIGHQEIYMVHGKNHKKFRPLYMQALKDRGL